ncbi:hypothetical protein [Halomonas korlensis]|nr:hypothetical protein [Halomonas korlensis]
MPALAMKTPRAERGASVDYQRLSLRKHGQLAQTSHPEYTDEAARSFVARLLDMEVERRTLYGDEHLQGYHNISSTARIGEPAGGTAKAREPLADLYHRGIANHQAHQVVRRIIEASGLTFRQRVAVLIQTAKGDRRCNGPRGMSYEQIVANPRPWVQYLGWPPGAAAGMFDNAQALKDAAKSARLKLRKSVSDESTSCVFSTAELPYV